MKPFVSVIIPCRNEAAALSRCLDSILSSDYPAERLEVVIADGESEDSTQALLAHYAAADRRVRIIANPARITPAGLNRAISEVRGDYILRVDAHSLISRSYVSVLVDFLESHAEAWGVGGMMTTVPDRQGAFADAIQLVLSHRFGVGNSQFRTRATADGTNDAIPVDTVFNCCWRRQIFHRIGLFHERLVRSQDIEFSSRIISAGGSLWLLPAAATTYFAKAGFWDYLRHNWTNGIWSILPAAYLGKMPVRWRHLIPLAFVSSISLSMLGGVAVPPLRWLAAGVASSYALAVLAISCIEAAARRNSKLLVTLPLAFAGLHLAYGTGSIWGCYRFLRERSKVNETQPVMLQRPQVRAASVSGSAPGTDPIDVTLP